MKKMNSQKVFCINKRKGMVLAMAAVSLASVLLTGCVKQPVVAQKVTKINNPQMAPAGDDVFVGMYKADEENFPMEAYTGALVLEGYRGTTSTGGMYTMPALDEQITGNYGEYYNEVLKTLAVETLNTKDGTKGYIVDEYSFVDFEDYGTVKVKGHDGDYQKVLGIYEIYTGKQLTPEEYLLLSMRDYGSTWEEVKNKLLENVEDNYKRQGMYDEAFTAEGLAMTLEAAQHQYVDVYYGAPALDANGERIGTCGDCQWDFRKDYDRYIDHMYYERNSICYLNMDMPGAASLKENMLSAVQAFDAEHPGEDLYVTSYSWIAGRYIVFRMELSKEPVTQHQYFFLNLLTGQEETYQQVYANMGMDKQVLSQKIRQAAEADYQQKYEQMTGTPFSWEHDEQLYQKTMASANADGAMIIPMGKELLVYYNAYLENNSAPVQRELSISVLDWRLTDQSELMITQQDMAACPGLEKLFEEHYGACTDVGYLNYGVWQCDGVVVIGIGWFDDNGNWQGFEPLCFDEQEFNQVDFYTVLQSAGMDEEMFETQLRIYLQNQPDFPG